VIVDIKDGFCLFKQSNHRQLTALCQQVEAKLNIGFILLILILCYHFSLPKNIIRMSQQEAVHPTTPNKKQVRKEVGEKLIGALADYKQELGEKKLAGYVKDVSREISRDLLKVSKKQKKTTKKATAKPAKKAGKAK
jgi:DNA-binding transcriptional regulator YbjK